MRFSASLLLSLSLIAFPAACASPPDLKVPDKSASPQDDLTLAKNMRQKGDAATASRLLEDAAAKQPDNKDVLTQLGGALIESGQAEQAVEVYDRLIALDPQSP